MPASKVVRFGGGLFAVRLCLFRRLLTSCRGCAMLPMVTLHNNPVGRKVVTGGEEVVDVVP